MFDPLGAQETEHQKYWTVFNDPILVPFTWLNVISKSVENNDHYGQLLARIKKNITLLLFLFLSKFHRRNLIRIILTVIKQLHAMKLSQAARTVVNNNNSNNNQFYENREKKWAKRKCLLNNSIRFPIKWFVGISSSDRHFNVCTNAG